MSNTPPRRPQPNPLPSRPSRRGPVAAVHHAMKGLEDRALGRFNQWFVSEGGVYQTFLLVMAVVVLEIFDRSLDPHAFVLMAILTVYSGITQPMLAYANNLEASKLQARIDQLEALLVEALETRS